MVIFNLISWRILEKRYQLRIFKKIFLINVLFILIFWLIFHSLLVKKQNEVLARVHDLKVNIKNHPLRLLPHQKKIKVKKIKIEGMYLKNHYFIKNLLNELERGDYTKTCLTSIEPRQDKLIFTGITHSAVDLTIFFRQWPAMNLFSNIRIEMVNEANQDLVKFNAVITRDANVL